MGLTVTRTPGQQIQLDIAPGTTRDQLREALQDGITIEVSELFPNRAVIFIGAPRGLQIYRPERHARRHDECTPKGN